MCGFVGIYDSRLEGRVDPQVGFAMRDSLRHRGPDGEGAWFTKNIFLGHTRLSILDLSEAANQPLFSSDRSVACVFNGEIYNHLSIRRELEAKGHVFKTHTDGEILPHLYQELGENLLERIQGMFALCIYDSKNHRLLLARDRFGIKPFYYTNWNGFWIFGSEIKAILQFPGLPRSVDIQAIHDYLSLGYVPEPATGFAGIETLMPKESFSIEGSRVRKRKYFSFDFCKNVENLSVAQALEESVKEQVASDVPVGAFLSGGLDSSTVVTAASRALKNPPPTFCAKFPDPLYDESVSARMVAETLGTRHFELDVPSESASPELIEKLLRHFDQPFGDTSLLPTFLICQEIRKHVTVALSGDGGDEVFSGYPIFGQMDLIHKLKRLPRFFRLLLDQGIDGVEGFAPNLVRKGKRAIDFSNQPFHKAFFVLNSWIDDEQKRAIYNRDFLSRNANSLLPTSRLFDRDLNGCSQEQLHQFTTEMLFEHGLNGNMLKKVDMMSMLAGIEVRVPLLSEKVVEAALKLKSHEKLKGGKGKIPLRNYLKDKVPEDILRKPKQGFSVPLDVCASKEFSDYARSKLLKNSARVLEFTSAETLGGWIDGLSRRDRPSFHRQNLYQNIFMLLSLEISLGQFYSSSNWQKPNVERLETAGSSAVL